MRLTDFFEVEALGDDRFGTAGDSPLTRKVLFGGALVGQALRSASLTVEPHMHPQSLHASFVRAGRAGEPTTFHVERVKDGRLIANRRVTAAQGDRIIMTFTAAFGVDEPGDDFQRPPPAALPPPTEAPADLPADFFGAVNVNLSDLGATGADAAYLAWRASAEPLPDDRVLACCAIAYLADAGPPIASASAIGVVPGGPGLEHGSIMSTSLDHAVWFHRAPPPRLQGWLLVTGTPVSTGWSRGLTMGTVYDESGTHIASFLQEMLIRQ